jgi:hypothetical protein
VLKNQRQPSAIKRRTLTKAKESDVEEVTVAEMRRLQKLESRDEERGEIIKQLKKAVDVLTSLLSKEEAKKPKDVAKKPGEAKKVQSPPAKAPLVKAPVAWQGPKPDWQTVWKKGKVAKSTTLEKSMPPKQKGISEEELLRFTSGQAPKQKGLKFIYIKGVQKWKYSQFSCVPFWPS